MTEPTPIPKILTVADWKAKRGVVAKMAGETGIGDALEELNDACHKVKWQRLDPVGAAALKGGTSSYSDYVQLHTAAKADYGKVIAVLAEVKAVKDLTTDIAKKWKDNKMIPASSRRHVENMTAAATQMGNELKGIDTKWQDFLKTRKDYEDKMFDGVKAMIAPMMKQVREQGEQVIKAGTVDSYGKGKGNGFHQSVRGLAAALARSRVDKVVDWNQRHFTSFSEDTYPPADDSEVVMKTRQVIISLASLDKLMK